MNTRLIAARIIHQVMQGASLSDAFIEWLPKLSDARDQALTSAICYGVCRYHSHLEAILPHLLNNPMQAKDNDIRALILVGLYQLIYMRMPDYAAVDATVAATRDLKKPWARGFVNAILREYLRQQKTLEEKLKSIPEVQYAHPTWWIDTSKKNYPEYWQDILLANNEPPPFSLRVNERVISREKYLHLLAEKNLAAQTIAETKNGIILENPVAVEEVPGFMEGMISVQDGAGQLAVELLDLKAGQRVLDACAAPGGKFTHILEVQPDLEFCVAVEKDSSRIKSIEENVDRLHLENYKILCADAIDTKKWWDGKLFDRILLDAPCSASGVIRRHPDIKLLRKPNDITQLAKEQKKLLENLWPLLKPSGIFLYATCSIFPQENTEIVRAFLQTHSDAAEEEIHADWGIACDFGRQILPGMHSMDGFYYAKLRKK